ncbi:MAG: PAS domain S-box protein, partial [Oceanobacter sp.]
MQTFGSNVTHCEGALHNLKTGQEVNVSAHLSITSDKQMIMTLVDETETRQVTRRHQQQQEFWSAIMEVMPVSVFVMQLSGKRDLITRYHNRSAAAMLGYPSNQQNEHNEWRNYATGNDDFDVPHLIDHMGSLEDGQTLITTRSFRHFDLSERKVRFEITPFDRADLDMPNCYIASARDVTAETERQQRIVESEARFRLLADNMTDIIWATDVHLNFTFFSASVEKLLGYGPDELLKNGIQPILNIRDIRSLIRDFKHLIKRNRHTGANAADHTLPKRDIRARTRDGDTLTLELQVNLLRNDYGLVQGLLGVCRDVTEERQNERELTQSAAVFQNTNEGILVTSPAFRVLKVNPAFSTITGFTPDEILGQRLDKMLSPGPLNRDKFQEISDSLALDEYWQGELKYLNARQLERSAWVGISLVRSNHSVESLAIVMSDISERKFAEERIHRLAYYDALTGLANRTHLHQRLERMMARAAREENSLSLLFIDLDRFKPINDSMGHPVGDQVLIEISRRLTASVKSTDMVARIGGDEFTVVVTQPQKSSDHKTVVAEIA